MQWLWEFDLNALEVLNESIRAPWLDVFFWLATGLGLGWVQGLLLLGLFARVPTRNAAITAALAMVLGSALLHAIKRLDPRLRPGVLEETFVAPDERIFQGSFPSGHTTTAFAIAVALALSVSGRASRTSLIAGLILATLVGVSRVYRGVHWPTDVIGGAALGVASALIARSILMPRSTDA